MTLIQKLKLALPAAALLCAAGSVQATELKMLNILDERYPGTVGMAQEYVKMVEEASGGDITFQVRGPETVPPFEQLQPLQAGVFDIHYSYPVFHAGVTTLVNALETTSPDPKAYRESGIWELIDEHYQGLGLKLISLPTSHGIQFVMREPLEGGDMSGLKIRGNPQTHGYIEALNGAPVVMPPGELYSAFDKGVIDGATYPILGALGFKWYEVACCFARPWFGALPHLILMNMNSWNELSEEQQKLLLEQGEKLEYQVRETFTAWGEEEEAKLKELGMQETRFTPEVYDRLIAAFTENAWEFAGSRDPEKAVQLRKLAEDAGLTTEHWEGSGETKAE
ncbi:MAG: TRAP transporter substrate-binding protein DctP [Rhodovibrionaceae bacterium]